MVRVRLIAALAASSVLLLSGCGAGSPGVAATVGTDSITIQQVDDLANGLCASGSGRATVSARNTAIQVLVISSLSRQFGAEQSATYDTTQLDTQMQSAASLISAVQPGYQATMRKIIEDYVKGQLMLVDLGGKSLTAQGQTPTASTSLTAGEALMLSAGIPVTIDPRFGTWANGQVNIGSGSLSAAVSSAALSADNTTAAGYTATLPSFGTCG